MTCIERLMGHGGVYDELGQVATMLGTGHADQMHCGVRVDAVRDAVDAIDQHHRRVIASALDELAELRDSGGLATHQRALLGAVVSLLTSVSGQ